MQNSLAGYLPLRKFWEPFNPLGALKGTFVLMTGYMDESYDGAKQDLFSMSCLVAKGKVWDEMERQWKLHLAAKNRELKKAGRPLITRYHAADCSGRRNEFDGWTHDERDEFVIGLFGIIKRLRGGMHTVGYDVSLDDLMTVFPEWARDRLGSGYDFLTKFILWTLGQDHKENAPGAEVKITLFHDRTPRHDATILNAFNNHMADPNFDHRQYFTTIAPLGWEDCIALQPADLVAFEVFKDAQARRAARAQRKSFKALLDFRSFGVHTRSFDRETLNQIRDHVEKVKAGEIILGMSTLTVSEKPDMTYAVSVDGELKHASVERDRLKGQLAHYNVVEERYDDVIRQLAAKGKARIEIPLGKFEQI